MDESRKQFEEWLMEKFGYREDYLDYWRGDGDFKHHPVLRARLEGWQASRAAIEIELPGAEDPGDFFCEVYDTYKVNQAMLAAGIKVKGA